MQQIELVNYQDNLVSKKWFQTIELKSGKKIRIDLFVKGSKAVMKIEEEPVLPDHAQKCMDFHQK